MECKAGLVNKIGAPPQHSSKRRTDYGMTLPDLFYYSGTQFFALPLFSPLHLYVLLPCDMLPYVVAFLYVLNKEAPRYTLLSCLSLALYIIPPKSLYCCIRRQPKRFLLDIQRVCGNIGSSATLLP